MGWTCHFEAVPGALCAAVMAPVKKSRGKIGDPEELAPSKKKTRKDGKIDDLRRSY